MADLLYVLMISVLERHFHPELEDDAETPAEDLIIVN